MFSGVFVAVEVDGVEDKGAGDTTTVDRQTLLVAFLMNMSLRSACLNDEAFSGKKQDFQSRDYFPQVLDNWMSLKEFCCMLNCTVHVLMFVC